MLFPYSKRPSLTEIPVKQHQEEPGLAITKFVESAKVLIAELLLFYPYRDIYFIARDMEYHYDISQILLKDKPDSRRRIHLINVTRDTLGSSMLKAYLTQEGFVSNRRIVLVDSGFNGNVIKGIADAFPSMDIIGFLIMSENPNYGSSHAAMSHLEISVNDAPSERKKKIETQIEQIAHYTCKAVAYERYDNKIEPTSRIDETWRRRALQLMGRIRELVDRPAAILDWHQGLEEFEYFLNLLKTSRTRRVLVELDVDCLYQKLATSCSNGAEDGCLAEDNPSILSKLPFGFMDFLRESRRRSEDMRFRVEFVSSSGNCRRISELMTATYPNGKNLACFGIVSAPPAEDKGSIDDWAVVNYSSILRAEPSIQDASDGTTHQKAFIELWRRVDSLTIQPAVSSEEIQKNLESVARRPEGRGFIRDLLEQHRAHQLGIDLRDEMVGVVWDTLVRSGCQK